MIRAGPGIRAVPVADAAAHAAAAASESADDSDLAQPFKAGPRPRTGCAGATGVAQ